MKTVLTLGFRLGLCLLATVALAANNTYEDDRVRVLLPAGWTASPATDGWKSNPKHGLIGTEKQIGGVLSKGKFRIYLLTHHGHASGAPGGRFSEVSKYVAPWMQVSDPWGCAGYFGSSKTAVTKDLTRVDLQYDPKDFHPNDAPECSALVSNFRRKVWFGSFFSPPGGGYFLTFPLGRTQTDGADEEMAFSATIATDDPTTLPSVNDPLLKAFLNEASNIVRSVRYKASPANNR